jgi:hypothetical protein
MRASSIPDRSMILKPQIFSARSRKTGPSSASRTAAVAATTSFGTPICSLSAMNRRSASSARSMPFGSRRPVEPSERPSPAMTFSLKTTTGLRSTPA